MLTTVHGSGMDEIREKATGQQSGKKERCFARYVVMKSGKHVGEIEGIYNERGRKTVYLKMVGCLGIVAATSGYGYSRGMEYQRQITDTGELQKSDICVEKWVYLCTTSPRYALLFPWKMQSELQDLVGTSGKKRIGDAVKKSCNNLGEVLRK